MIAEALSPFLKSPKNAARGVIVTAILPGGCQLDCPFCIVKQRGERQLRSEMTPEHYSELLHALARHLPVRGAAIAGDEPLQETAWSYTEGFLSAADSLQAPTALITNGLELSSYAPALEEFSVRNIYVSLDGVGERHDVIRRKKGAFAEIAKGIEIASESPHLRRALTIAAVLMPGNIADLSELIAFAGQKGIRRVALSPLVRSRKTEAVRAQRKAVEQAIAALPRLMNIARQYAVELILSDEFGLLGEWDDAISATGIYLLRPSGPLKFIRVDAAGLIETYDTIRSGTTTGLRLPERLEAIDEIAQQVAAQLQHNESVAA